MVDAVRDILVDLVLRPEEGGFGLGVVAALTAFLVVVGFATGGRAPFASSGESDSL
jgi:hypothetical protein